MLTLTVFVAEGPLPEHETHVLKAVQAVAARFPERVTVEVLPISGERAEQLGLRVSPTVVEGGMVLSVGADLSAGRLKRYVEMRLAEVDGSGS